MKYEFIVCSYVYYWQFSIPFRWPLVEQALLNPEILQSDDLIEAILSYNRSDRWNFDGLKCFLDECIEDEEKSAFYTTILPKVFRDYNLLRDVNCYEIKYEDFRQ